MVLGHTASTATSFPHWSEATTAALAADEASACDQQLSDLVWRQIPVRSHAAKASARELWEQVRALIDQHLTQRQREVVELYFLRGMDQATVAMLLGISQQSVSEHLHGKTRGGEQVGGVLRKLRKLCTRQGIVPADRRSVAVCDDEATDEEQSD